MSKALIFFTHPIAEIVVEDHGGFDADFAASVDPELGCV
jgi:hypothetical protein